MHRYITPLFSTLLILISSNSTAANNPLACWHHPERIQALDKHKSAEFLHALSKKDLKEIQDGELSVISVYQADVTNEGKFSYVVVSGDRSLLVSIFKKTPAGIAYVSAIPRPSDAGDGPFYFSTYRNNDTGQEEFLTKLCGKTYLSFGRERYTYLVNQNITKQACDDDWANYERALANKSVQQKQYDFAYHDLNRFIESCKRNKLNFSTDLSLKNDLAFIAFKAGNIEKAKEIVQKIYADVAFKYTSPEFKNKIAATKSIIEKSATQPRQLEKALGKNEFNWLLDKKITDSSGKNYTNHLKKLLSQITPRTSNNQFTPANLYEFIHAGELNIIDNRFVTISNFMMGTGTTGFIWVDTEKGVSLVGLCYGGQEVSLTSKNLNSRKIPANAKKAIKEICLNSTFELSQLTFFEVEKNEEITLPTSWLTK